MLGALARGVKDGAIALSLKAFINDKFSQYGDCTDCSIDTKNNKLTLHIVLKGEREKVIAVIERYEIEAQGDDSYIVLKKFSASREWLSLVLNRYLKDKRYKLPAAATKFL